ncbi:hypothetical protein C1Y40_05520 [Mycobacterium talmoniae]|uniref:Uncharacterized protein n=1 Tax=Mycobacterium talmoniae TaxID=1858794 RepID=A0A2S8BCE3_9MYCO|nr:hypothetical protein C1Y40_05520 [Mycobacterium talmoniae]
MHRGLGDAIHIDQAGQPGVAVQPHPKALRFQGFPAENHRLKFELIPQLGPYRVDRLQRIKRRRGLAQHIDPFGDQQGVQLFG